MVNWGPFYEKKIESLTVPKKLEGGPFGIFQHPFCRKISKKNEGGPFGDFFSKKKSHRALQSLTVVKKCKIVRKVDHSE